MKDTKLDPRTEVLRFYRICKDIRENVDGYNEDSDHPRYSINTIGLSIYYMGLSANEPMYINIEVLGLDSIYPGHFRVLNLKKFEPLDITKFWKGIELLFICFHSLDLVNKDISMVIHNDTVRDYLGKPDYVMRPERMGLNSIYLTDTKLYLHRNSQIKPYEEDPHNYSARRVLKTNVRKASINTTSVKKMKTPKPPTTSTTSIDYPDT